MSESGCHWLILAPLRSLIERPDKPPLTSKASACDTFRDCDEAGPMPIVTVACCPDGKFPIKASLDIAPLPGDRPAGSPLSILNSLGAFKRWLGLPSYFYRDKAARGLIKANDVVIDWTDELARKGTTWTTRSYYAMDIETAAITPALEGPDPFVLTVNANDMSFTGHYPVGPGAAHLLADCGAL